MTGTGISATGTGITATSTTAITVELRLLQLLPELPALLLHAQLLPGVLCPAVRVLPAGLLSGALLRVLPAAVRPECPGNCAPEQLRAVL